MIHGDVVDGPGARVWDARSEPEVFAILERAALSAAREIGACDLAGIGLVGPGGSTSYVARHATVELLDELQRTLSEGPVVVSERRRPEVVAVADLLDGSQWSSWDDIGVRAYLGFTLFVGGEVAGVLNLYSFEPEAFTASDVAQGLALAEDVVIAIGAALERDAA
ncbi:GAF domain-containing protein [Nocardioides exalbidus]|uniref:GAF domain-containing protein n=1 Tax=Nocardioides exalbidus TaxID=402596 RepID=A0A1H4QBH8_9ACTN|nr:GAF domain-containing protein [Nocardioides exalbidus]SEC17006.1 GAF domain-containing protein [Nocardioides exalbidus]